MRCETIPERGSRTRILVAEKNAAEASLMKGHLEVHGHEVILAEKGSTVLRDVELYRPDVVLLDCAIPEMDGAKICRELKGNREMSGIPIIVMTERASLSEKINGLAAGADDFVSRPYDDEELSALICARLRTKAEWDDLRQKTRTLEEMLMHAEALAQVDPLTGSCNRRHIESILQREFKRALRYDLPLSCMMIDIDHFKKVNDRYGHLVGDQVLRETVSVIQRTIRDTDYAARWGGEEFVIVTPNTVQGRAAIAAEKLRKAVADHAFCAIGTRITVSIGVAGIPDQDVLGPEELLNAADLAMYRAKEEGRNRVAVASFPHKAGEC